MPITKSAKKALRSSGRKRALNTIRKEAMKDAEKALKKALGTKESSRATNSLSLAYKAIDKALKRGIIKKNTAARKKSRLSRLANKASKKA